MKFQYDRMYDVVVCGGGTAGVIAAIAAARRGAATLLIERQGFLGGTATFGGPIMSFLGPEGKPIVGGIAEEIIGKLKERGATPGHIPYPRWNSFTPFNPEEFKNVTMQAYLDSGGELLLHGFIVDAEVRDNRIASVIIETGDGKLTIRGKFIIDASGDAHIAYKAGAPLEKSFPLQAGSTMIRLGGFNKQRFVDFVRENPQEIRGFQEGWNADLFEKSDYFAFCGLFSFLKESNEKRGLGLPREFICFNTSVPKDTIVMVASRTASFDATSVVELTQAEIETRGQDSRLVALLKQHVPGFEDTCLISSGYQIGIRETRRLKGAYVLSEEDILVAREFEDTVALGGYPIDVHYANRTDNRFTLLKRSYEIPFRCLYAPGIDNLAVAGRPISVSPVAYGSTRVQSVCMAVGEAAGTAAALAVAGGIGVEEVGVRGIKGILRTQGAIVDKPVRN